MGDRNYRTKKVRMLIWRKSDGDMKFREITGVLSVSRERLPSSVCGVDTYEYSWIYAAFRGFILAASVIGGTHRDVSLFTRNDEELKRRTDHANGMVIAYRICCEFILSDLRFNSYAYQILRPHTDELRTSREVTTAIRLAKNDNTSLTIEECLKNKQLDRKDAIDNTTFPTPNIEFD